MTLRPALLLAVTVMAITASFAWGEAGDAATITPPTDLYTSYPNGSMAIPSGAINIVPGDATANKPLSTTPATATDTDHYLGCGGVGEMEYTTGLFNMPETYGKFTQDVDSYLAKQIVSLNFIMPQAGALFDQLNNFGHQRYQIFQNGCNLDALKTDAKKQFLDACVAKVLPTRAGIIAKAYQESGTDKPKEPLLSSMAYAQAWEVCLNSYVSETTPDMNKLHNDQMKAFAEKVRSVENVTKAIEPLLCDGAAAGKSCWATLLIPQARLCLDSSLGCAAPSGDDPGYTITEPLLTMPRLFDTFRFIVDDLVITRKVAPFNQKVTLANLSDDMQTLSAAESISYLSMGGLARATNGDAETETPPGGAISENKPDDSVKAFQLNYLNCKESDILKPLKIYADKLKARATANGGKDPGIVLTDLDTADIKKVIDRLHIDGIAAEQTTGLQSLSWVAIGCAANQSIPMLDPNITAAINTQCKLPADRYAFYSMAGYDVALTATQNTYRYLALRLKQVYARLLTDPTVPGASTLTKEDRDAGKTDQVSSPELNARLAKVVKEAMIPQVEAQLDRLNELANNRGVYAQRVQQIYASKSGCMYGASGSGSAGKAAKFFNQN